MILYSVSACGKCDGKHMLEPIGYDFLIKFNEDRDIAYMGFPKDEVPDMIVRVLRDGKFDDIVFSLNGSLSTPTRDKISDCATLADELRCYVIAMASDIDAELCAASAAQSHEILLHTCAFRNMSGTYDGYRSAVFADGNKVIEKSENIITDDYHDWAACDGADAELADMLIDKYTRFDNNTFVSEEFAQNCAEMMSDEKKSLAFDEMRDAMIQADLPIDAIPRVKMGSYAEATPPPYSFNESISTFKHMVKNTDK